MVFQVEQEVYERVQRAAKAERRSMSNWLAIIIERAVESETAERGQQ
jgi:predicted CopG family antitoxin